MSVEINWLAVVLATLASMVISAVWYAKGAFGAKWIKLVGMTEARASKGAGRALVIKIVANLITAHVLAYVIYLANQYFGNSFLQDALTTAFWAWLGFIAARIIPHNAFEQRSKELTIMSVAHEFVTFMAMALVIGLIGL